MNEKVQIATAVLAALVARPDSGLFNYEEKAEIAFLQAEALERRFLEEHKRTMQAQMSMAKAVMASPRMIINPPPVGAMDAMFEKYTSGRKS